jgi:type IV pilus assembly protein PilN
MRITLNLATRPFADLGPAIKRLRIAMGVLALISILFGLGLHAIHRKAEAARARDHSLDGQIARISEERQGYETLMHRPDNAQVLTQAAFLNGLFDAKAFSWTLAMEDLETVLPPGVQVTNLEPARQKDGHIVLHQRVLGPRDHEVELIRNLEHSRRFLLPRVTSENAQSTEGGGQNLEPVSPSNRFEFDLLADYNPATPQEAKALNKSANKSAKKLVDSDQTERPTPRVIRPLSVPSASGPRPPYTGSTQSTMPGAAAPKHGKSSPPPSPNSPPGGAQ